MLVTTACLSRKSIIKGSLSNTIFFASYPMALVPASYKALNVLNDVTMLNFTVIYDLKSKNMMKVTMLPTKTTTSIWSQVLYSINSLDIISFPVVFIPAASNTTNIKSQQKMKFATWRPIAMIVEICFAEENVRGAKKETIMAAIANTWLIIINFLWDWSYTWRLALSPGLTSFTKDAVGTSKKKAMHNAIANYT